MRQVTALQLRRLLPPERPGGPAYRWLATMIRALIADGRLPLEARMPAERELAAALAVSRSTTTAAYRLLRDEGYLASRRGAGTFTSFPAADQPGSAAPRREDSAIDL